MSSTQKRDVAVSNVSIDRNCAHCDSPRDKAPYRIDASTNCLFYVCSKCGFNNTLLENDNPEEESLEARENYKSFSSGAVRSKDADGTAYSLISPIGLRRLAETYKEGSGKYGDYNWEKGMPVREMLEHSIRHHYLYLSGDRSEDHLAHAAWNLFGAMHSEEKWPHLNQGQLREPQCEPPSQPCCSSSSVPSPPPTNMSGR